MTHKPSNKAVRRARVRIAFSVLFSPFRCAAMFTSYRFIRATFTSVELTTLIKKMYLFPSRIPIFNTFLRKFKLFLVTPFFRVDHWYATQARCSIYIKADQRFIDYTDCCISGRLRYCSSYANANVEQLKALLFNYDDQTTRFKRIKTWQDVGLIRVGSAKLEVLLRPSPER